MEHILEHREKYPAWFKKVLNFCEKFIKKLNKLFDKPLHFILPNVKMKQAGNLGFWSLFYFAFTIPFILGLDDFAGYVPLFNIVNIFGFGIGIFLGHMLLNIFLYLSPSITIKVVKNPIISFAGALVFIGLGFWGLTEVVKLVLINH